MKSPVWFVLAKIDVVSGSTGFHRAYLIDRAVATFSQWWMLGTRTTAIFGEQIHGDITNEYIWQGINGGILTMVLFILVIVNCFRGIGRIEARADVPLPVRFCAGRWEPHCSPMRLPFFQFPISTRTSSIGICYWR